VWDFERFIRSGCVDVIQPDLSRCGGLTVARQVAALAEEAGIDLVPHSWLTHLLTGYSLQLIATLPRARFVEFNVSQSALTRGITRGTPFRLEEDGTVAIPISLASVSRSTPTSSGLDELTREHELADADRFSVEQTRTPLWIA
jgi:L-alanine-DL-glutamate epimerase-like enolase superfamily enzyme